MKCLGECFEAHRCLICMSCLFCVFQSDYENPVNFSSLNPYNMSHRVDPSDQEPMKGGSLVEGEVGIECIQGIVSVPVCI